MSIINGDDVKLKALKSIFSITGSKECKGLFYSIDISDPYNIILTTKNGLQVRIGDWTNTDYKIGYVLMILKDPQVKSSKGYIQIEPEGTAVFKKY
jgi:cell division protein FtsQ